MSDRDLVLSQLVRYDDGRSAEFMAGYREAMQIVRDTYAALRPAPPSEACGCTFDAELGASGVCPRCHHRDHGASGCRADRPTPPYRREPREAEAYAAGRLAGFEEGLDARPAPPSGGLPTDERLATIIEEMYMRGLDGMEAAAYLRAALASAEPSAADKFLDALPQNVAGMVDRMAEPSAE